MFIGQFYFFTLLSFSQALRISENKFIETDSLNSELKSLHPRSLNNGEKTAIKFQQDNSNDPLGKLIEIAKRETTSSSEKNADSDSASERYNEQEYIPEPKDEPGKIMKRGMVEDVLRHIRLKRGAKRKVQKRRMKRRDKKEKRQKKKKKKPKTKGGSTSSAGGCQLGPLKPSCYSIDLGAVAAHHPFGSVRPKTATKTDSCHSIRAVPKELRTLAGGLRPEIHKQYTKYTEAYGIPVIGSSDVSDAGLRRACYVVKLMFASRYDIRNAYYQLHGRIALIGNHEHTTSIPEYWGLDKKLDMTTRGIGPTVLIPVTSAGDDNMRCSLKDRYFNQDILFHELAHGVHQLGAKFVMPGFQKRLLMLYHAAMKAGKYKGKYAAVNANEYFAVGVQFYFNTYLGDEYTNLSPTLTASIKDRDSLRQYDCGLAALLDEIFPCAIQNGIVPRCGWKECTAKSFTQAYSQTDGKKSGCERIYTSYSQDTPDKCARLTCHLLGNAFNHKNIRDQSTCIIMKCETNKDGTLNLNLTDVDRPFNIYKINKVPVIDFKAEAAHIAKLKQFCTKPPKDVKNQCKNTRPDSNKICGFPGITSSDCVNIGCCWIGSRCYLPNNKCADRDFSYCADNAATGDCTRNPGFMLGQCPLSCNICDSIDAASLAPTKIECKDILQTCKKMASYGKCAIPTYKNINCRLTCQQCRVPSKWYEMVKLNDVKLKQL